VWGEWLGVLGEGPGWLLALARVTSAGAVLPGLLEVAADADTRSWDYWCKRIGEGWDWRTPDTRREAALGLATRAHATELFESLRLGDPAVARREAFSGNVVAGTVTAVDATRLGRAFTVVADVALSRLRVGTKVGWWAGEPGEQHLSTLGTGRVADAVMDASGRLSMRVQDVAASLVGAMVVGQRVTLRPVPVDPMMQQRARSQMARRYNSPGNWVAGRGRAPEARADVPLDVILAAAGDD